MLLFNLCSQILIGRLGYFFHPERTYRQVGCKGRIGATAIAAFVLCSCSKSAEKQLHAPLFAQSLASEATLPVDEVFTFEVEPTPATASISQHDGMRRLLGTATPRHPADLQVGLFRLGAPIEEVYRLASNGKTSISLFSYLSGEVCPTPPKGTKVGMFRFYPRELNVENHNLTFTRLGQQSLMSTIEWYPDHKWLGLGSTFAEQGRLNSLEIQHQYEPKLGPPNFTDFDYADERETITRWCTTGDTTCHSFKPARPSLSLKRSTSQIGVRLSSGTSALSRHASKETQCLAAKPSEEHLYLNYLDSINNDIVDAEYPALLRVGGLPASVRQLFRSDDGSFRFCRKVGANLLCFLDWPPTGGDFPSPQKQVILFTRRDNNHYYRTLDMELHDFVRRHVRNRKIVY